MLRDMGIVQNQASLFLNTHLCFPRKWEARHGDTQNNFIGENEEPSGRAIIFATLQ